MLVADRNIGVETNECFGGGGGGVGFSSTPVLVCACIGIVSVCVILKAMAIIWSLVLSEMFYCMETANRFM